MKITSPVFAQNEYIPSQFTCDGTDENPPLEIHDVPEEAKSLVLIVDDPDAPRGTWTHWTLWNIPLTISTIAANSVPAGARQGTTSFGRVGYAGPCPPNGTHRYYFKLFALDTAVELPSGAGVDELRHAMEVHVLAKAETIGVYKRP